MTGGVWVLVMILQIGQYEVILKPIAYYDDEVFAYYDCIYNRDTIYKDNDIPRACVREADI